MSRALAFVVGSRRTLHRAAAAAVLGALLLVLALVLHPRQALAAYLAAYAAAVTIALGALVLLALGRLLRTSWLAAFRSALCMLTGTLPLLAALFVPIALGVAVLYPWVAPAEALQPPLAQRVYANRTYLDVPFWLGRAALYFAVWIVLARILERDASATEVAHSVRAPHEHGRARAAVALIVLVLSGSFAAYDWLKSLAPHWASGIYGLRVLAGGVTGALAVIALLGLVGRRERVPASETPAEQPAALGALLLIAVLAWGYTVVPPWIIVWSANLPVEVSWYVPRVRTSWGVVGLALVLGHLALPAVLLLVREWRTRVAPLGVLGLWLLAMHVVDAYWLVLPDVRPLGLRPHLGDVGAVLVVGGLVVAWTAWRSKRIADRDDAGLAALSRTALARR